MLVRVTTYARRRSAQDHASHHTMQRPGDGAIVEEKGAQATPVASRRARRGYGALPAWSGVGIFPTLPGGGWGGIFLTRTVVLSAARR